MVRRIVFGIALLMSAGFASAQRPAPLQDELADKLVGAWNLDGSVMGRQAHHRLRAQWVLGHEFLRLEEETSADAPASESRYEAIWFLGYDDVDRHYVLHLMDLFGGRFSETLGNGVRDGNVLRFNLEYPDGPFRTTWAWDDASKSWKWHMEQKNKAGEWTTFADFWMTPGKGF
jgi:hypothetical protein